MNLQLSHHLETLKGLINNSYLIVFAVLKVLRFRRDWTKRGDYNLAIGKSFGRELYAVDRSNSNICLPLL